MGVGHPGHKDAVPGFVLRDFPKADEGWLDDVLRGCSDGAPHLAHGDGPKFMNAVALRVAPPRSGTGEKSGSKPKPSEAKVTQEPDARSTFQKLKDHFS